MKSNPLRSLESYGQSVWLDYIRRSILGSGELQRAVDDDGVSGVTSNPAIFEKAIDDSPDYDAAIRALAREGLAADAIYEALVIDDIQQAATVLRPTYDRLQGSDGFVSLEVSPRLAHDTGATIAEARRLWAAVDRPNVMIKVPGTAEGLPAVRQLITEGINVNVTLLFGLPRYREVVEVYLAGLESRVAEGRPIDRVASVASFFLSRIDTMLDPRLEAIRLVDGPKAALAASLQGQVAISSAKVAYAVFREVVGSERFRKLAAQGAKVQRLLWASTGTKNPAYPDVKYVEPLVGPDTITTLPPETLAAYRDHGDPAPRLDQGGDEALQVLRQLAELGIDLDEATRRLEEEGVAKFLQPFTALMETLRQRRAISRAGE